MVKFASLFNDVLHKIIKYCLALFNVTLSVINNALTEFVCTYISILEGRGNRELRKLHNEELNDLYSSPNIVRVIKSRRMTWAGQVTRMGWRRGVYRVLVRKLEGKRPLGRARLRWEDNIKMDLHKVGCGMYQAGLG